MPLTAANIGTCARMIDTLKRVADIHDAEQRLAAYTAARIPAEQIIELDEHATKQIAAERTRRANIRDMGKAQSEYNLGKALERFEALPLKRNEHRKPYQE
tara:strand:+ start:9445 stop:9747 length:303 start_codon:yes stop_codon:yes gene_type:complete